MLDSLVNKNTIIKKNFLELIVLNNPRYSDNFKFIFNNLINIKSVDSFISGIILMSNKNYFGIYSIDYNDILTKHCQEKNKDFLKSFLSTHTSKIFKNKELDKYYNIEKYVYFYLYQKKFYDINYNITLEKITDMKKKIYQINNLDINSKYFLEEIIINFKKGNNLNQIKLFDSLVLIIKNQDFNTKLKDHILESYYPEYMILCSIYENYK